MSSLNGNIYSLTAEREKHLWENAIFIFDSSSLLNFYFLPINSRKKIFSDLFAKVLKQRLWIPSQVMYEYDKNREKVIKKPISESYIPLEEKNLKQIRLSIKDIDGQLNDLKNKTQKDDRHPYFLQDKLDDFIRIKNNFSEELETFEKIIKQQIYDACKEIESVATTDDVYGAITNNFEQGRYYKFEEIMLIVQEGDTRYKNTIPPGYKDFESKEKRGIQIYGDLIIWKQILEFAAERKRPIIFICDDLKEDWCYGEKDRIKSPREELVKEIFDYAGVEFWMYSQPQFLFHSNEYFKAKIEQEDINTMSNLIIPASATIKYVSWGNSQWEARFEKLNYILEVERLVHISYPVFVHRNKETGTEHTSQNINYISEAGENWTAICKSKFDALGNVYFTFAINREGDNNTADTSSITFIDWDGDKWEVTITPINLLLHEEKTITFNCKKIS